MEDLDIIVLIMTKIDQVSKLKEYKNEILDMLVDFIDYLLIAFDKERIKYAIMNVKNYNSIF